MINALRGLFHHPVTTLRALTHNPQRSGDVYEAGLNVLSLSGGVRRELAQAVLSISSLSSHARAALYRSAFMAALSPQPGPLAVALARVGLGAADRIAANCSDRTNGFLCGPLEDEQKILTDVADKIWQVDRDNHARSMVAFLGERSFARPSVQIARARASLQTCVDNDFSAPSQAIGQAGLRTLENPIIQSDEDRLVAVDRHVQQVSYAKDNPTVAAMAQVLLRDKDLSTADRLRQYTAVLQAAAHLER